MEEKQKTLKKIFRQKCLNRLRKSSRKSTYMKDKSVLKKLYKVIEKENVKSLMLYLPLKIEVDICPLIRRLRQKRCRIYVPFMEGESFRLVKYRYPFIIKHFGIKEPKNSRQYRNKQIDLAVVPIVGIDITYRRVGFGKGMYDRFFKKEIKNIKKIVFVARELCYSKEIVTDHYDIKADLVIVP
ncbi:MAG: 5-formyltetrahydrofolate cyclo-ligase [Sulfurovum sp.]|nr:5-formyltetrahydrofolate cyclo-ligase [Sulfurovum sp.]